MGLVAPRHVGSSLTMARTCLSCTGRRILNHCTTREAPGSVLKVETTGFSSKVDMGKEGERMTL